VVEHPLGKGEVHSSILCGSTTSTTSSNSENNGKFKLLPIARATHARVRGLPATTGTNRETLARVTRFWHAGGKRTGRAQDVGIRGAGSHGVGIYGAGIHDAEIAGASR
jgi:hypothetical protein